MNHQKAAALLDKLLRDPIGRALTLRRFNLEEVTEKEKRFDARVAIIMPSSRNRSQRVLNAWHNLVAYSRQFCDCADVVPAQGTLPHVARNEATTILLKHPANYTHFLYGDDDNVPEKDALVRLLETGEPVISGLYVTRSGKPEPVAYRMDATGHLACISGYRKGDVVEVEGAGAGFLLVKREVLEKIAEFNAGLHWESAMYGFDPSNPRAVPVHEKLWEKWRDQRRAEWFRFLPGTEFGEDISFFIAARGAGFIPKVHTEVEVGHEGTRVWMPSDLHTQSIQKHGDVEPVYPVLQEVSEPSSWCPDAGLWHCYDLMSAEVETLEFLGSLVRLLKPKVVVETGTFEGWSALHMGKALRENGRGHLTTLEVLPELQAKAEGRVKDAHLEEFVTCLLQSSLEYRPEGAIDLFFSDSALEVRLQELDHFRPHFHSHTLIVLHDTMNTPALAKGLDGCKWLRSFHWPTPRGLSLAMLR